jgi:hypothetical protein
MTDGIDPFANGNGEPITASPPEIKAAIDAVARARIAEVLLVIIVCVGAAALVATTAWNTYRLRQLTQNNVKAQQFGLQAVRCILDNLADHRWSNQVFHDNLGAFLHAPLTPHVPLVIVPTDEQFAADCAPFNLSTERREGTGGPTVTTEGPLATNPTTTTMGGEHVSPGSTTGR